MNATSIDIKQYHLFPEILIDIINVPEHHHSFLNERHSWNNSMYDLFLILFQFPDGQDDFTKKSTNNGAEREQGLNSRGL